MVNNEIERAIAALVLDHALLDPTVAVDMIVDARKGGRPLGGRLADAIPEEDLLTVVARELGFEYYNLDTAGGLKVDTGLLGRCDIQFLLEHTALPMVDGDGNVIAVCADPSDMEVLRYLRTTLGRRFRVGLAQRSQVRSRLMSRMSTSLGAGNLDVPAWTDHILARAVTERASDIVIRLNADGTMFCRLRVDGGLRVVEFDLPGREREAINAILTRCDSIDPLKPKAQDGTFRFTSGGHSVDARVAVIPTVTGPNVTVRILDPEILRRRPEDLGFDSAHLASMRAAVRLSQGLVLVVGPTGSGKSTTQALLLKEIDAVARNVVTIEDPVEYRLPHLAQIQVRETESEMALSFADALRNILRQAPDVILVGEIRDDDTAKVVLNAANTGHLVMSTLHTNHAVGVYQRLGDMGGSPFVMSEVVSLICSQRLVRKVHDCARIEAPTERERAQLADWGVYDIDQVAHPTGCSGCNGSGFLGRVVAAESIEPTEKIRNAVAQRMPAHELRVLVRDAGFAPLLDDGVRHVRNCTTTVAEVASRLIDDEEM